MTTTIHVIDPDVHRRAQLAQEFSKRGLHVEIYEDIEEFGGRRGRAGYVFVADFSPAELPGKIVDDVRANEPVLPLVLYAAEPDVEMVVGVVRKGAFDYVRWPFSAASLDNAIKKLVRESDRETQCLQRQLQARGRVSRLTGRELSILKQMVQGKQNRDIAEALGISSRTVEIHRKNMMTKLLATSAGDAVRTALDAGI